MSSPISAELPLVPLDVDDRFTDEPVVEIVRRSFESFYFEHRDAIARTVALATGDVDQAADSVDEAMIRAYQRWSHVGDLDQPAGWVFRVAINHSRSRLRRVARKARYAATLGRDRHDDTPFSEQIGDHAVLAALQRLPHDQRCVVVLRVLLEFSERECAEALGIRPGTAKSRLHRALSRLRQDVPHLAPDIDAFSVESDDPTNAPLPEGNGS